MRIRAPFFVAQTLAMAVVFSVGLGASCAPSPQAPAPSERDSRTPAQRKINSQLLYEIYRLQGTAAQKGVPTEPTGVRIDDKQRAFVDVRADVTPELQQAIETLGGTIVSTSERDRSTLAWIPLLKLEQLAEESAVTAIEPAAEAITR
jgi:hypothetical protein